MDLKYLTLFVLYFVGMTFAQDLAALLRLAGGDGGGGGGGGGGGAGCPLQPHHMSGKFIQGGIIKDCAGGTVFNLEACGCIFPSQAGASVGGGGGADLSNLLSGGNNMGLQNPLAAFSGGLSGGSSGESGLQSLLLSGAGSGGDLSSLIAGGAGTGDLSSLISGGAGTGMGGAAGLGALLGTGESSSSSELSGLSALLAGGGSSSLSGGGLGDLLLGGTGGNSVTSGGLGSQLGGGGGLAGLLSASSGGGGGLGDLLGGGSAKSSGSGGGTDAALNALLGKLTLGQGSAGTPIGPKPAARRDPNPVKSSHDRSGGLPPALMDLLSKANRKTSSSKRDRTVTTRSKSTRQNTSRRSSQTSSNNRQPPPAPKPTWWRPAPSTRKRQQSMSPPSRPPSMSPPTRRTRIGSRGSSNPDPLNQLLSRLGATNPTSADPIRRGSSGRRSDALGGAPGLADLLGASQGYGGASNPQDTRAMAQLLASIDTRRSGSVGSGGGQSLGGGSLSGLLGSSPGGSLGGPLGGPLSSSGGPLGASIERIISGLSGGLGVGALAGGSALRVGQLPDLTSMLNQRGAMMSMTGAANLNAVRNLNPATLIQLDRQGLVDLSDLRPQGMLALANLLGR